MRRLLLIAFIAVVPSIAMAQAPSPKQVDTAIAKGKAFLYSLQQLDGTWERTAVPGPVGGIGNEHDRGQWGGRTALAVYALLACGEKAGEPKLAKAIEFLHQKPVTGTYAVAVKCLVWLQLPNTDAVRKSMKRDAGILMRLAKPVRGVPVWDYGLYDPLRDDYSLSRSQYAALGLWAASEMDIEIPINTWKAIERAWEMSQTPEGGWRYTFPGDGPQDDRQLTTVAMTASALATLYIARDFTKADYYAGAKGNAVSPPIEKGMSWMVSNFARAVAVDPAPSREFPYPQLYSIERTGLASGLRRFGSHDWYAIGARFILSKQGANGALPPDPHSVFDELVNTAFAILFLQRGRTPVAFNKFDYTPGVTGPKRAVWNQRPRDIANVTRWLSRSLERELRWQVVRADDDLAALLEAPVLYLSGDALVEFRSETKVLLRQYVEHGGLIVANADMSKEPFARAIMSLGAELFPLYEWRDLPDDHPIWTNQNYKRQGMRGRVPVKAIGNGVREFMILLPLGDPARAWQLRDPTQRSEAWQTIANILSYATDKTVFHARGQSWLVPPPSKKPSSNMTVGRLKYAGNWDPEPEAIRQLSHYAATTKGFGIETKLIEAGRPIDASVALLLVCGTVEFQFGDATREAIRAYTRDGGVVLFENSGGAGGFAGSAEREMELIFGPQALAPIPSTHAVYGVDLKIAYRPFNIHSIGDRTGPLIRGVERDGRLIALLSKEDLSAGWLGVPTDGIMGYQPESARALMTQILSAARK